MITFISKLYYISVLDGMFSITLAPKNNDIYIVLTVFNTNHTVDLGYGTIDECIKILSLITDDLIRRAVVIDMDWILNKVHTSQAENE